MDEILDFVPMTDYESINFMLLLPFSMEADDAVEYSREEIDGVLQYAKQLNARAEAAEAEVARLREALELAEAEVERLLSELSDAVDGHWDAEPSWYADKALTASPYADGAYDNTTE